MHKALYLILLLNIIQVTFGDLLDKSIEAKGPRTCFCNLRIQDSLFNDVYWKDLNFGLGSSLSCSNSDAWRCESGCRDKVTLFLNTYKDNICSLLQPGFKILFAYKKYSSCDNYENLNLGSFYCN